MKPVSGWISNQDSYSNEEPEISGGPNHPAVSVSLKLCCCFLNKLLYNIKLQLLMLHVRFQLWYRCTSVQKTDSRNAFQVEIATASTIRKSVFSQVLSNTNTLVRHDARTSSALVLLKILRK